MHRWEKSPPELVERFVAVLARLPAADQRKMFGYPAAFANGHMFTGLHERRWVVRLPGDALAELLAIEGAAPFEPMPGRPMKGFACLPASLLEDPEATFAWVERAFAHVAALPPTR